MEYGFNELVIKGGPEFWPSLLSGILSEHEKKKQLGVAT